MSCFIPKVEVDVLGSPSLIVPNGLCGREATLNLNVTSCWGGWGVGGGGGDEGGGDCSDFRQIYYSISRADSTGAHALSHPQSEKSVPRHALCLTHTQSSHRTRAPALSHPHQQQS